MKVIKMKKHSLVNGNLYSDFENNQNISLVNEDEVSLENDTKD